MGVILNANYRIWKDGKKQTVPAPVDPDTPKVPWWYDKLAQEAADYKRAGFSAILLPPVTKTQGGHANDADGYGKLDDWDIGSKDQSYGIPTRFGTAEQLRRMVAISNACGLDVYGDVVLHQYDGGRDGVYNYPSATGKANGRFPKTPSCFVGNPPRVPVDPVFSMEGNFAFGDMCSYVNSQPHDYMAQGAIDAGDWLIQNVGFKGLRVDDVKGMNTGFVHRYLTSKAMAKVWAFGEEFDGNPDTLNYWVWNSGMNGRASVIDFTVHWHLQSVCDYAGRADDLLHSGCGYFKRDPYHAVTYVESPDTDLTPGQQIVNNKGLAYWYILTSEGQPIVYFRDYSSDPNCYGLKKLIDNLIWTHSNLAFGATIPRFGDGSVCCFERVGYPGLLSAGNWDTWNRRTITVQTNFGPHVQLHDYAGHHADIWTDGSGRATFTVPSNAYSRGQSFLCFSRTGYGQSFKLEQHDTTQHLFGAEDLDLGPAIPGQHAPVTRLWCKEGTTAEVIAETTGSGFLMNGVDGKPLQLSETEKGFNAHVETTGWQTLLSVGTAATPTAFRVRVTYRAPTNLSVM